MAKKASNLVSTTLAAALTASVAVPGFADAAPGDTGARQTAAQTVNQGDSAHAKALVWTMLGYNRGLYNWYMPRFEANLNAIPGGQKAEVMAMLEKLAVQGRSIPHVNSADAYAVAIPAERSFHIWDAKTNKTLLVKDGQIYLKSGKLPRQYMWYYSTPGDVIASDGQGFEDPGSFSSIGNEKSFFGFPGSAQVDPIALARNARTQQERKAVDIGGYIRVTKLDQAFCALSAKRAQAVGDDAFATQRQRMTETREAPIPGLREAKIDLNDSPSQIVKDIKKIQGSLTPYELHYLVAHIIASDERFSEKEDITRNQAFIIFKNDLGVDLSPGLLRDMTTKIIRMQGYGFDRNAFELRFGKASAFFNFDNDAFLSMWRSQCGPVTAKTLVAGGAAFQEAVADAVKLDQEFPGIQGEVAKRLYAYVALDGQDQTALGGKVARAFLNGFMDYQRPQEFEVTPDGQRIAIKDVPPGPGKIQLYPGTFETAYAIYAFEQMKGKSGEGVFGAVSYGEALRVTRDLMKKMESEGVFTERQRTDLALSYHMNGLFDAFKGGGLTGVFSSDDNFEYIEKTRRFLEFAYDNATYTDKQTGETRKVAMFGLMANMFAAALGDGTLGKGPYAPSAKELFGVTALDGKITNAEQQARDNRLDEAEITEAMSKLKAAARNPAESEAVGVLAQVLRKAFWAEKGSAPSAEAFFALPVSTTDGKGELKPVVRP